MFCLRVLLCGVFDVLCRVLFVCLFFCVWRVCLYFGALRIICFVCLLLFVFAVVDLFLVDCLLMY